MYAGSAAQRGSAEDGFGATVALLAMVGFVTVGHGFEASDGGAVINSVRCRVRCLSVMQRSLQPQLSIVYESITLLTCLREEECESCLRPCTQPFSSVSHCEEACQLPKYDLPCRESCQFLEQVNNVHRGLCLPQNETTTKMAPCVTGCHGDVDCHSHHKCCRSSCGSTCQQSNHLFDDTPAIPDRPVIRERTKAASVELRWNPVASNLTFGPVLYIVDSRWNIGPQENESDMSPWHQAAQTTATSTIVSDITPGHWYQFRVSAANINGRKGSSHPTKAFTVSKEPRRPDPPNNVTEGDTLIMGGKVAVNMHWFHPKKSDLPVSRYKLFWSKKSKGGATQTSNEFREVVPGDQVMFQIPDLDPDSTYFVQIQAICQYGEIRLKSDKVSLFIMTYPLPKSDTQVIGSRTLYTPNPARTVPTPPAPLELHAHHSFYHNGVLKANVSWRLPESVARGLPEVDRIFVFWSPEACIADHLSDDGLAKVMSGSTQENYFVIYDLRFDCRYLVRVQSVTNQGVLGVTRHLTLATPSCYETSVVGQVKPDCPNSALRLPDAPSKFKHSFIISSSNITARLVWDDPPSDSPPISSYRVIWGQMPSPQAALPGSSSTLTKVLSREARSFALPGLQEGTTYAVRLQALSRAGAGRGAALHFTTPLLHVSPRNFREKDDDDDKKESSNDDDDDNYYYRSKDEEVRVFDTSRHASIQLVSSRSPSSAATPSIQSLLRVPILAFCSVLFCAEIIPEH